jgi:OOP family OmpA-OmpF porin
MSTRLAVLFASLLVLAPPVQAQFGGLLDSASRKAQDAAAKAAVEAAKPSPPPAPSPAPAAKPAQPAAAAATAPTPAAQGGSVAGGAPAAQPGAGEVYGNRFDFVPGDKVMIFDDFSDTDVGEFPAKWTLKGDGGGGNPLEVVQAGDRRFLKSVYKKDGQEPTLFWLRYPIKGDMPKNFTIEFDADIVGAMSFVISRDTSRGGQEIVFTPDRDGNPGTIKTTSVTGKLPPAPGIQHVAIAVSGTQAKVYVGGERVAADPDAVVRPITRLGFKFGYPGKTGDHQMFTNLRIAEGGKPAKQVLAGEGRIVTHGILFDTGSDVIKPESGPTLRSILSLLQEDPALRFAIEGHTDDQGGPKVNGPLSERRAAAVKAWLEKQGVAEGRLTSKGLGQSKPIDTNDTAEGRANNRRVEFVKA